MTLKRHHRRSIRLKGYDYTRAGAYFVTIVADERQELFGAVVDGEMRLSRAGEIVRKAWFDLPRHYPNLQLDEFCIMPNHVHGIIILTEDNVRTVDGRGGSVQAHDLRPARVTSGNVPPSNITQTRPFGDGNHDRGGEQGGSVHADGHAPETVMYGEASVPDVGQTRPYGNANHHPEPEERPQSHTTRPDNAHPVGDGRGGSVQAHDLGPERVTSGNVPLSNITQTRPFGDANHHPEPEERPQSHATRPDNAHPIGDGRGGSVQGHGLGPARVPSGNAPPSNITQTRPGDGAHPDDNASRPHGDDGGEGGRGGSFQGQGRTPETVTSGNMPSPDVGQTRPYNDAPPRHGLPEIVRAFKSYSARRVNIVRRATGVPVWQRNYYEHIVRNAEEMARLQQYIHQNPLRWETDQENPARQTPPQPKDRQTP